jgi:hypothetical protein
MALWCISAVTTHAFYQYYYYFSVLNTNSLYNKYTESNLENALEHSHKPFREPSHEQDKFCLHRIS